jgi:hypothetical protein
MSRRRTFALGAAAGAVATAVALGAQAAYAGTGVGSIFNLGRTNTVGGTSTLTGTTAGAQLQVTNRSKAASATGLSITVPAGRPPLKVSSTTQVPNLNASYLQGKRAADFLPASGTAADAAKLGGQPASSYLRTTGTAADSSKLGGVAASEYVKGCPLLSTGDPVVGGSVAARAIVSTGAVGSSLGTNGVMAAWSCSGGAIWAQRYSTGTYCVVVDPAATFEQDTWTYAGRPATSGLVVPMVTSSSRVATVSLDIQLCGDWVGVPGHTQYLGYVVTLWDRSSGSPADGDFSFVLM